MPQRRQKRSCDEPCSAASDSQGVCVVMWCACKAEWLSHSFPHSRQRRDDLILDSPGRDFKYSDSSDAMGSTSLSKSAPLRPSQRQRRDRSCFTLVLIVHSNITIFVLFKTSILLHLLFTLSQVYIWVLQSILLFQADLVGSFGMNLQMLN